MTQKLKNYQLLDSGHCKKLEQVGPYRLIRPSPQAIWPPKLPEKEWKTADASYTRHAGGDGKWNIINKKLPAEWVVEWDGLSLVVRLTSFGHLGIFPEHHHIDFLEKQIERTVAHAKPFRLLHLFAYTGVLSIRAMHKGAQVVHVDASKASIDWAMKNKNLNEKKLAKSEGSIRFIHDDVLKFVKREIKRGSFYQGIVLDPPSFGRGPKNELWKIDDHLVELLELLAQLRAPDFSYWQLSCHSPGYTPLTLENLLALFCNESQLKSFELSVPQEGGRILPSGVCSVYVGDSVK